MGLPNPSTPWPHDPTNRPDCEVIADTSGGMSNTRIFSKIAKRFKVTAQDQRDCEGCVATLIDLVNEQYAPPSQEIVWSHLTYDMVMLLPTGLDLEPELTDYDSLNLDWDEPFTPDED